MKTGLVLEGGALRTIFSSGVCDAFLNEKLPMPDYTIGVSAGIAYGYLIFLFSVIFICSSMLGSNRSLYRWQTA